jgi:hypothetical protein
MVRNSERIVIDLPLRNLWDDAGPIAGQRGGPVDEEEIRTMLKAGTLRFVVADCGQPLHWEGIESCWAFWTREVRGNLCFGESIDLARFPHGYCYTASEWHLATGERVVVLECHH